MTPLLVAGLLATSSSTSVTLEEVVARALRDAESPRIAATRVEQAKAGLRSVWAGLLPTLTANGTYRRRAFEVAVNRELEDGSTERAIFQANDAFAGEVRLRSTIFSPRSIPDVQASEEAIARAEHDAEEARRSLAHEVADAFIAVRVAELARAAAERRTEVARREETRSSALVRAGLVEGPARDRLELDRLDAETTVAELGEAAAQARLTLELLTGGPVTGGLAPFEAQLPARSPAQLTTDALKLRPDVASARAAVASAEHAALAPWLAILPTLGLDGVVNATNETGFNGRAVNWNVALTLDWTLYDGGARYAEARTAVAALEAAKLELQSLERTVSVELRQALQAVERARATLALAERRRAVSARYADSVQARLRQGLVIAVEAADAAAQAFAAEIDQVTGTAELNRAILRLRRALGQGPV